VRLVSGYVPLTGDGGVAVDFILIRFQRSRMVAIIPDQPAGPSCPTTRAPAFAKAYRRAVAATTT
jgi:hypothetical protein